MTKKAEKPKDELCIPGKQDCGGMEYAKQNTNRYGVQTGFALNAKLSEVSTETILRFDKKGSKTLLLNFCPFCGRALHKKAKEFEKSRRRLESQNKKAKEQKEYDARMGVGSVRTGG